MVKRNRMLCLLLSLSMAAGLLSGCAGGTDKDSTSEAASVSTPEAASEKDTKAGEPMVLELAIPWPEKYTEDQQVRKMLEEKYNVKFEYHVSPGKEGVNLQIASGDTPDYMVEFNVTDYWNLVDQGVLAEVPVELLKEHAPRYCEWVERESGMGENVWEQFMKDGKNYAMLNLWTLASSGNVMAYRQDLLEQAGISKAPETIDEMETAFKAIKDKLNIPAFGAEGGSVEGAESMAGFGPIFGAFGTYLCMYEEDGKLKYGPIQPEAKQALEVLNRWYEAGYIDPEFIITKHEQMNEKFANSEVASASWSWWNFTPKEAFFGGDYYETAHEKDPEVAFTLTNPPKGPEGKSGITQQNPIIGVVVFGKHLENEPEKLAKYLEVFDGSFDREVQDLLYYGIKGETYTYDEETGRTWIPPYDSQEKRNEFGIDLYLLPGCFNDYDLLAKYMTQPQYMDIRKDAETKGTGKYDVLAPYYRPVYNAKSETINKIYQNAYLDFITGERPLSEFDQFVEEWLANGGQEVLEEGEEQYKKIK